MDAADNGTAAPFVGVLAAPSTGAAAPNEIAPELGVAAAADPKLKPPPPKLNPPLDVVGAGLPAPSVFGLKLNPPLAGTGDDAADPKLKPPPPKLKPPVAGTGGIAKDPAPNALLIALPTPPELGVAARRAAACAGAPNENDPKLGVAAGEAADGIKAAAPNEIDPKVGMLAVARLDAKLAPPPPLPKLNEATAELDAKGAGSCALCRRLLAA